MSPFLILGTRIRMLKHRLIVDGRLVLLGGLHEERRSWHDDLDVRIELLQPFVNDGKILIPCDPLFIHDEFVSHEWLTFATTASAA